MLTTLLSIILLITRTISNGRFSGIPTVDDNELGEFIISISETTTTITISFEENNGWVGIGFGQTMDYTNALIYEDNIDVNNGNLIELTLIQHLAGTAQEIPLSWTISSRTRINTTTTITISRSNTANTNSNSFIFDPLATHLAIMFAMGSGQGGAIRSYHGSKGKHFSVYNNEQETPSPTEAIISQPDFSKWNEHQFEQELFEAFRISGGLKPFLATTVRLIFHDCGGPDGQDITKSKCDGCIDFDNADHGGLVMRALYGPRENLNLEIIYERWNFLTRADFWAAAATAAVKMARKEDDHDNALDEETDPVWNIPYLFGRRDCEDEGQEWGDVNNATKTAGPKPFPNAKSSFRKSAKWFEDNMGFEPEEVIALLGVHTLGLMHGIDNSGNMNTGGSGFGNGGSGNFWVPSWDELDNDFYKAIVDRPGWAQAESIQGLWRWNSGSHFMLGPDIGMFLDLHGDNDNICDDKCMCVYPACTAFCSINTECQLNHFRNASSIVKRYANNNALWLKDFAAIFTKLVQVGWGNLLMRPTTTGFYTTTTGLDDGEDGEDGDRAVDMYGNCKVIIGFVVIISMLLNVY
eukprot:96046_1